MRSKTSYTTIKEQAFHPPVLDLITGFPLRLTVPSCV
uniref:Uncharacterized protein n=1 Tax=Rhizophora mucronata TaxID=61149 RepID=A0A2P2QA01_RHIMU